MSTVDAIRVDDPVSALHTPLIDNPCRPGRSAMLVLMVDVMGLGLMLKVLLGHKAMVGLNVAQLQWWPLMMLFLVLYWICGVYPGISVSPVDDVKRISIANAGVFLIISLMLVLNGAPLCLQLSCPAACIGASAASTTMRSIVRRIGSRFDWWGYPIALFGGGDVALSVLHKLKSQPHLGLRPVALVTDRIPDRQIEGVTVCHPSDLERIVLCGVKHAVVAAPELSQSEFAEVLERGRRTGAVAG